MENKTTHIHLQHQLCMGYMAFLTSVIATIDHQRIAPIITVKPAL